MPNVRHAIGEYQIVRRIAVGGMSEVFLARDAQGLEVVVKTLSSQLHKKRFVKMFLREADVSKSVQHPNVVRYLDSGIHEGTPYLVLEYLQGMTARDLAKRHWARGESLTPKVVAHLISKAAEGLSSIHALNSEDGGLVHRDISPDNLFVTLGGQVKVLDLGISRGASASEFTKTGELKGKVPYMSPEQVDGRSLDGRSDLFSLGVSAYWLLARHRPFRGSSDVHVLNAILDAPAPPFERDIDVPTQIKRAVFALLEKRPEDRPQNAAKVAKLWSEFGDEQALCDAVLAADKIVLSDEEEERTSFSATKRLLPSHRRSAAESPKNGVWAVVTTSVLLLVLVFAVIFWTQQPPTQRSVATIKTSPTVYVQSQPHSEKDEPDAGVVHDEADVKVSDVKLADALPAPTKKEVPVRKKVLQSLTLNAPPFVQWSHKGKTLGMGSFSASLPKATTRLTARDTQSGLVSSVPVRKGSADYSLLPEGTYSVRAVPFARVKVGERWVGVTPIRPQKMKVGNIDLVLIFEGKAYKERIQIRANEDTQLTHRFEVK